MRKIIYKYITNDNGNGLSNLIRKEINLDTVAGNSSLAEIQLLSIYENVCVQFMEFLKNSGFNKELIKKNFDDIFSELVEDEQTPSIEQDTQNIENQLSFDDFKLMFQDNCEFQKTIYELYQLYF
jgi:hypothetical protein